VKKIKLIIIFILIFITLINSRNIYNAMPFSAQSEVKRIALIIYEKLGDKGQLFLRISGLDIFKHLNTRYRRLNPSIMNLNNDYNVKFLPSTQTENFYLNKYQIEFEKKNNHKSNSAYGFFRPFYIELYDDFLLIFNNNLEAYYVPVSNLIKNEKNKLNYKSLKTNFLLSGDKNSKIMGTLIYEKRIYISYLSFDNNCQRYNIASAKINFSELKFENFFKSKSCGVNLNAGRMKVFKHNDKDGLLVTVGGEKLNEATNAPQNLESDIGKILFIDFKNKEKIIFSLGHRNPQGLFVDNKVIIATEHGPRGGDEINKIEFKENYGWPIASYGFAYNKEKNQNRKYLKEHQENNFKEPIFSFVPSIGISEIIKIPDEFHKDWKGNFVLSSLNAGSLYRIKFNKNFNKILYMEKIFVNSRIRDLKYSKEINSIILALEDFTEIGILSPSIEK